MSIKKIIVLSLISSVALGALPMFVFAEEARTNTVNTRPFVQERPAPASFNLEKRKAELEKQRQERNAMMQKKIGENKNMTAELQGKKPMPLLGNQDVMKMKQERIGGMLEKRKEIKAKLKTERNKMILDHVSIITDRLGNAADRLIAIGAKLEARIEKMAEKDANLTRSKELLAQFETKALEAKQAVADANTTIDAILGAEITKETGMKVREALKKAEESVRSAHKALLDVVTSVKVNVNVKVKAKNNVEVEKETTSSSSGEAEGETN